jgi:hypothetical protein
VRDGTSDANQRERCGQEAKLYETASGGSEIVSIGVNHLATNDRISFYMCTWISS